MCLIDVFEMTEARDNRRNLQLEIITKYHLPLISFTLNIPGPRKSSLLFTKIHNEGISAIKASFPRLINLELKKDLKTGPEAYFVIKLPVDQIKRRTIEIEEKHSLGRIFDIDVFDENGIAFSRSRLSHGQRKCFICDDIASLCSRSRKHTVDELIRKIESVYRLF